MFARIFSRRHKQMTFSDAGCLGILRVKIRSAKDLCNVAHVMFFFFLLLLLLIFFIAYVMGTDLNRIDKSMQFK